MEKIIVSESGTDCSHIAYLYHSLSDVVRTTHACAHLSLSYDRATLRFDVEGEKLPELRAEIVSAVADIIAVGYKYAFFRRRIPCCTLSHADREILFVSLIAADLSDDREYLIKKLKSAKEFSIDGFYHFRMEALKEKWKGVADLMPERFSSFEFERFVAFLLEGERKSVFVKDNEVFDERYRKLRRSRLIGSFPEYSFLREVILSRAKDIRCLTLPGADECGFLKKYYGARVFFD